MAGAEAAPGQRLHLNPTDLAASAHLTWATGSVGPTDLVRFLNITPGAVTVAASPSAGLKNPTT